MACATGHFTHNGTDYEMIDLPGTYSLAAHSEEEEIAREYICSGQADIILVVCDATCLERGLHLLKQIQVLNQGCCGSCDLCEHCNLCAAPRLALCVNLCDEARKKGIVIDFAKLEQSLSIPVAACAAREKKGLDQLMQILGTPAARQLPAEFSPKELASFSVTYTNENYRRREEVMDRLLTGRFTGSAIMVLILMGIFWLTITGANYPSAFLWDQFYRLEGWLAGALASIGAPGWLVEASVYGVYRVVAWIVSVMLPPMAIFFPLFTLLEDLGYLPRVAFNMDCAFKRCKACGKQCLTMW